ncbi:sulfatase [Pontiellaceae bacterium B12227]|nr:sulfatase [Pontiellaceae bacterium B12227]
MKKLLLKNLFMVSAFICFAGTSLAAPKNFIIILADDQGYEDLGCFGSSRIKTPHIDRMAAEGMKLTSFYTASSVCSPSRAALMTGRLPKRVGVPRVLFPHSKDGLPESEITVAELLKTKGYATGLVGKWHLGHRKQFLPTNQGFDSYFGIPYSNNMSTSPDLSYAKDLKFAPGWSRERLQGDLAAIKADSKSRKDLAPLMRGTEVIEYPVDQSLLTRRYAEEAVRFINENKDRPFFLYLAHAMPHTPILVSDAFKGSSESIYCDSIQEIDWSVGEIFKALRECGLEEDTFVLFSSDNGPASAARTKRGRTAGPLRGNKFETFEGGHRVPTVAWAPGSVQADAASDAITSGLDILPTIAHWAGIPLPDDRIYDGYNLTGLLTGRTDRSPRNEMMYYAANSGTPDGIRVGDWKYLNNSPRTWKNGKRVKVPPTEQLFNLKKDIGESENLIQAHPEKVQELKKQMKAFDAAIK